MPFLLTYFDSTVFPEHLLIPDWSILISGARAVSKEVNRWTNKQLTKITWITF